MKKLTVAIIGFCLALLFAFQESNSQIPAGKDSTTVKREIEGLKAREKVLDSAMLAQSKVRDTLKTNVNTIQIKAENLSKITDATLRKLRKIDTCKND